MTSDLISFWREYDPDQAPFVHPDDDRAVREQHRAPYKSYKDFANSEALAGQEQKLLHLGLLPEPYVGDLNQASVFMLMANPGLHPSHYYLEYVGQSHREIQIANLRQQVRDLDYPFYRLDPSLSWWKGFNYWQRRLKDVLQGHAKRVGSYQEALKAVSRIFCVIQLIPYRSARFWGSSRFISQLRSAQVAINYVQDVLLPRARNGEITVIVARARRHWAIAQEEHDGRNIIVYSPGQSRGGSLTAESKQAILSRLPST